LFERDNPLDFFFLAEVGIVPHHIKQHSFI
jgi:hypothetical protein